MRIGTFSCWLFGHKFLWNYSDIDRAKGIKLSNIMPIDYCCRCGIDKPKDNATSN